MELISRTCFARSASILAISSKGRSPRTCRWFRRASSSSPSTFKRRARSGSGIGKRKRRGFISLLGGAEGWPLVGGAQQSERVPRVGVLIAIGDDAEGQARLDAFKNGMRDLGWTDGGNVRMEVRFAAGS